MRKISTQNFLLALMMLTASVKTFAQIPNAGFENWTSGSCTIYSYKDPNSWGTLNSSTCLVNTFTVQKTTAPANVHSGTAALELYSQYISFASATAPGICVTGNINETTNAVEGGFAQTTRPDKLIGYYQYVPVSPDTFSISVNIYSGVTSVVTPLGTATVSGSTAQSTYKKFIANISYTSNATPDSAQITLLCSAGANGQSGTKMYIDDLAFVSCAGFTAVPTTVNASCNSATGSITLATPVNGTAPFTYAWSNNATTTSISNLTAGTYRVSITDDNGCQGIDSIVVTAANAPFTLTATGGVTACNANTGTVSATASAGTAPYTYVWSNAGTAAQITNLGPGNYTVVATDAHGCTTTATAAITTPNGPSATDSVTNLTCNQNSSGAINAQVTGGTSPINYAWSNNTTAASLTHISAGNYTLTVTDGNQCSFTLSATVNEPTALSIAILSQDNVTCFGGATGSATALAGGGTIPYLYSWNSAGGNDSTHTGLVAGTYTVAVSDSNFCSATATVTIIQPTQLIVTVGVTNASSATASDGAAFAIAHGGTGNITYQWDGGFTHDTINHLSPSVYCVTTTDNANCTAQACDSVEYSVSINNISSIAVKLYPNPANSHLTIETDAADGKYQFTIYSLDGKIVDQRILTGAKSHVELNRFATGFYTYQLKDIIGGNLSYGKLQIQR